jgi:PKD domain
VLVATAVLALLAVSAPAAFAQPTNDDFAGATVVPAVPFSTTEDTTQATFDPTDPFDCSSNGSVWFAYTAPSDATITANTFGSDYDTVLSAWTGSPGAFNLLACNDDANGTQSRINFQAPAGTTVYFMVAVCCGGGSDGGGSLAFSVDQLLSPDNDNFVNATPITGVPFSAAVNLDSATTQPGEPQQCGLRNTVWYSFTAAATQSLVLRKDKFGAGVAVYSGTSLSDLTQLSCGNSGSALLPAQAGTTYYVQLGLWCCNESGPVTFRLEVAPDPVASFSLFPSEPSPFDAVDFFDTSRDPAGGFITSWQWTFGDGATATGCCPRHQYPADGDYTAALTVTTADGRSASTSRVVQVRTHDLAIIQLAVPNNAHVGQTVDINVYVRNSRYPETAQVTLSKSGPGGFSQVGSLTQAVPVRPPGGTSTRFAFSYTITQADKTIGKISFQATVSIIGHRDALPADNELTSPPVKIN